MHTSYCYDFSSCLQASNMDGLTLCLCFSAGKFSFCRKDPFVLRISIKQQEELKIYKGIQQVFQRQRFGHTI